MTDMTKIHITIAGEVFCRGEGCPYCADDHLLVVRLMQFALDQLCVSGAGMAEMLAVAWEQRDAG